MLLGSKTVLETLALIEKGNVVTTIQEDKNPLKTAHKLDKENCKIDWSKSGTEIYNLIRGLSPYPSAWCFFSDGNQEWNIKIYKAEFEQEKHSIDIGTIVATKKDLKISVKDGFIKIINLQFPGKKRMDSNELLNGMDFSKITNAL